MTKKLSLIVAALMLVTVFSALAISSYADEPALIWDFGTETDDTYTMNDFNAETYTAADGYGTFTASGADPYAYMRQTVDDVNTIQWCKVRVRNTSKVAAIELFASTDGDGHSLGGPECTHICLAPDADNWRTYVVYLPNANIYTSTNIKGSEITEWNWQGSSDFIRLDSMWNDGDGATEDGDSIDIDYIAFFGTKADALAFRADQDYAVTPVEFENSSDYEPDMEPNLLWDFGTSTGADVTAAINAGNALSSVTYEETSKDAATFTAGGLDPNVMIPVTVKDVSALQWAKIRVKNTSPATAIELFAKTDGDGHALAGPECTHLYIVPNTDEWLTYIVYLPNANIYTSTNIKDSPISEWNWQGTCDGIRLDPMWQGADGDMSDGDAIEIDYIAFFANKADAENFRKRQDSAVTPVEFENGTDLPDLSVMTTAAEVVDAVENAVEDVKDAAADAANAVADAAENAAEAAADAASNAAETVKEAASGANIGLIIGIVIAVIVVVAAVVAFLVTKGKKKDK